MSLPTKTAPELANPEPADPEIAFSLQELAMIQRAAVEKAKQGDMQAAAIVERMWRRRRRTVSVDLPPVNDALGLAAAQATVIAAAAAGKITPREGMAYAAMLDYRRRALDTVEFEGRLRAVERAHEERALRDKEGPAGKEKEWWQT